MSDDQISQPEQNLTAALGAWSEYADPGDEHHALDGLIGQWHVNQRFRTGPDEPFHEATARAANRWTLGSRFVELKLAGEAFGESFECLGYLGYDLLARCYVFVWMETAATMMEVRQGEFDPVERALTLRGVHLDPATRESKQTELSYRFKTPNSYGVEIAELLSGERFVCFTAEYRRDV